MWQERKKISAIDRFVKKDFNYNTDDEDQYIQIDKEKRRGVYITEYFSFVFFKSGMPSVQYFQYIQFLNLPSDF